MSGRAVAAAAEADSTPLLEAIRLKEREVKRRLAVEAEAAQAALGTAERQAREIVAAAEADGRREGEQQSQMAQAEADAEAQALVARADAEAERLQQAGAQRMEAAVQRAVALVSEVRL